MDTAHSMEHIPSSSSGSSFVRQDEGLPRESERNSHASEAQGELLPISPNIAADSTGNADSQGNAESDYNRTLLQRTPSTLNSVDTPKLGPEAFQKFEKCLEALSQDLSRHYASVEDILSTQGRKLDALDSKLTSLSPSAKVDWPPAPLMTPPIGSASQARMELPRVPECTLSSGTEELLSSGPRRTAENRWRQLRSQVSATHNRRDFSCDAVIDREPASHVKRSALAPGSLDSTNMSRPNSWESIIRAVESNLQHQKQQQQQQQQQDKTRQDPRGSQSQSPI